MTESEKGKEFIVSLSVPSFIKDAIFGAIQLKDKTVLSAEGGKPNKENNFQVEKVELWDDGTTRHTGISKLDKYEGTHKWFFKNGNLKAVINFKNHKKHGKSTHYYPNGNLKEVANFKNGVLQGSRKQYSQEEDLVHEFEFENGYLISLLKLGKNGGNFSGFGQGVFPDGKPEFEGSFSDGVPDGFITFFHKNGKVRLELYFKSGVSTGMFKEFWENGQLKIKGEKVAGRLHKLITYQAKNGFPLGHDNYAFGLREGTSQRNYDNGKLKWKKLYHYGKVVDHIQYNINGEKFEGKYKEYSSNGGLILDGHFSKGKRNGAFKYFSKDGKISKLVTFRNGQLHGKVIIYDEDGNQLQMKKFVSGKAQGESVLYYPNGLEKGRILYKNDEPYKSFNFISKSGESLNGEVKTFYKDDKVKTSIEFKDGAYHGIKIRYNRDGNVVETQKWENGTRDGLSVVHLHDGKKMHKVFRKGIFSEFFIVKDNGENYSGALVSSYKDGQKRSIASYVNGRLNGTKKEYYYNGKVFSEQGFSGGKPEGAKIFYDWDGNILYKEEISKI